MYIKENSPYNGYTDVQLVALFQLGSESAFEALTNRYKANWHQLLLSKTHNSHDARDIVQTAHLFAIKALRRGQYRGGSFESWFGKIAINVFLAEYNKKKKRGMLSLDDETDYMRIVTPAVQDNPEKYCLSREFSSHVLQSIKRLDPLSQKLLELAQSEDNDYKRIMEKLVAEMKLYNIDYKKSMSYNNIRVLVCRARKEFKDNLRLLQAS